MTQTVDLVRKPSASAAGKRVAVWGASFKAGTDDVRDSAGLLVADRLRSLGATVTVYDPMGSGNALVAFPELAYADSAIAAAAAADVIVVVTAWPEFAQARRGGGGRRGRPARPWSTRARASTSRRGATRAGGSRSLTGARTATSRDNSATATTLAT